MAADRSRSILIATIRLTRRGGVQVVTRDLALELARRGWRVAVYAPTLGPEAEELAGAAEVTSDLSTLTWTPDVIHGHQHMALAAALVRFGDTPAIQVCHNADAFDDAPLRLERVRRHVAVDLACRARVCAESGLTPDEVPMVFNAVDLARCAPRGPLPARPARALVIATRDRGHVERIVEACRAAGLETQVVGYAVGRPSHALEAEMAGADIVFGAARTALEAMAVGCAVVVADARGFAGMAASPVFDDWRAKNFGRLCLTAPVTGEAAAAAIAGYDAADAAAVSARVRAEAHIGVAADQFEAIYDAVIAEHAEAAPADEAGERRALAAYLQRWLPSEWEASPFAGQVRAARAAAAAAETRLALLVEELARRGLTVRFEPPPASG